MKPINKTILIGLVWLVLSCMFFFWILPKFSASLVALQNSHQQQINQLNDLNAQAKSVQKMQEDLDALQTKNVHPDQLFTSDVHLVNEIKQMENDSSVNKLDEALTLSGTADKALPLAGSVSGLYVVPYAVTLKGSFPNVVNFLRYLENSYFVSPVTGMNISYSQAGSVNATILSNFYIRK